MPGPGPYGNKKQRRKQIATRIARTRARLEPNKPWSNNKDQFQDTYWDVLRYNLDDPPKYKKWNVRVSEARAYNRWLRKKFGSYQYKP